MIQFKKATKLDAKARIALIGISGSGKTYSALRLAHALGEKIAVIDTESGSASKYADEFDFAVLELTSFHPQQYIDAIKAAEQYGFDVLIIDSLSHAWFGKDGELETVDKAAARSQSKNTYFAWREVTPLHNRLIDTILQSKLHIIATLRSKAEYVVESINGKQVPRKVGMAPVMRDGIEYEFDIVMDLDSSHSAVVTKTRCRPVDGMVFSPVTEDDGNIIREWLRGEKQVIPPANKAIFSTAPEAQVRDDLGEIGHVPGHIDKLSGNALRKEVMKAISPFGKEATAEFAKVQHDEAALKALYARYCTPAQEQPPATEQTDDITPEAALAYIQEHGNDQQALDAHQYVTSDPEKFWALYDAVKGARA